MVKTYKLHKFAGISAGVLLLILSISGFFLNHDKWSFLYTTTFTSVPSHILNADKRLYNAYHVDKQDSKHIIVGSYRGLFESLDGGESFVHISTLQILALISYENNLYCATSDGIYIYKYTLKKLALENKYITSLSISEQYIVAVEDKETIITLDRNTLKIVNTSVMNIKKSQLQEDIKLSRFVRDLHYGRGLFEGDISLLINDYGAIVLTFLALSGYTVWFFIKRKRHAKFSRALIKTHANIFSMIAIIPLLILAITGVFLDHSSALKKFMNGVKIPHSILPPVYDTLASDIFSIDYDGKVYRIGNRYGIYKSEDLSEWNLENRGLAYKMIRKDKTLYISGMGAANRLIKDEVYIPLPKTPHMFRDVIIKDAAVEYFSTKQTTLPLPNLHDLTLYSLLLALHDGSFFSEWWVWVNDFAAFMLLVLSVTGTIRWYRKKRLFKNSL
ncbi:PepSY domain-containing protein [Sulfurimonas sp. SAG-AH-194-C21]|nr:PepSY-associated TM helix domain-containing protein [Sulfurimonas sp. SAG-AH-194-C21]MDF1884105.1 PepSY domain-containing protein [Sulfurimonas sp. SAG-AH-194-C21]